MGSEAFVHDLKCSADAIRAQFAYGHPLLHVSWERDLYVSRRVRRYDAECHELGAEEIGHSPGLGGGKHLSRDLLSNYLFYK